MAAIQNSSVPPSTNEYGGDEVNAIILDPGFSSTRAGFAGEDTPKSVCPSFYAVNENGRLSFGDHFIDRPRFNVSIKNPMSKDGIVEDFETATQLWEFTMADRLIGKRVPKSLKRWMNDGCPGEMSDYMEGAQDEEEPVLADNPLFMTECGWNPTKAREKTIEIAMETFATPAYYVGRTGVMAAFASGKSSALVVDIGASTVSVSPIHDGILLKKGLTRSPLGGNFISTQIRAMLASNTPPIALNPHYTVESKTRVDAGEPAQATYATWKDGTAPDPSFREFQEERILKEFKECVVQVWQGPGKLAAHSPEDVAKLYPARPFEFPDGYNQLFGHERYRVAEALFDHTAALPDPEGIFPAPPKSQTIPELVKTAIDNVDVDIRPHLLANVVVTGGTSLLYGFSDRLSQSLMERIPGLRVKVNAAGSSAERMFGSWIGGSILASLGAFHQNWISKREYEEHGANIVEKRCK